MLLKKRRLSSRICICMVLIAGLFPLCRAQAGSVSPGTCLSSEEEKLVQLLNQYRVQNGLAPVPVSYSLTLVGQWHVQDLNVKHPDTGTNNNQACNMHSWSNWHPELWHAMCYTADDHEAQEMWDKPRQISQGAYQGNGYEIAYSSGGQVTAEAALAGWQQSTPHREVILEQGSWSGKNWPAIGVGLYQHYAVIWFGETADTRGINLCGTAGANGRKNLPPMYQLLLND